MTLEPITPEQAREAGPVYGLASDHNHHVVSGHFHNVLQVRDIRTNSYTRIISADYDRGSRLAIAANGEWLAAGSYDSGTEIIRLRDGTRSTHPRPNRIQRIIWAASLRQFLLELDHGHACVLSPQDESCTRIRRLGESPFCAHRDGSVVAIIRERFAYYNSIHEQAAWLGPPEIKAHSAVISEHHVIGKDWDGKLHVFDRRTGHSVFSSTADPLDYYDFHPAPDAPFVLMQSYCEQTKVRRLLRLSLETFELVNLGAAPLGHTVLVYGGTHFVADLGEPVRWLP